MSKSIIIGVVALLVVGGAFLAISNQNGKDTAMEKQEVTEKSGAAMEQKKPEGVMEKKADAMSKAGSYETYSAEKIAMAANGDVVLFFHASWCPSCREVDADIKANLKDIPSGLTILDVDYDTSSALKQKYGVTYQHTFVQVDAQGNQLKKWSGSPTLAALVAEVK